MPWKNAIKQAAKNGHWIRSMWETLQQRGGKKNLRGFFTQIPLQVSSVGKKKKLEIRGSF